MPSHRLRKILSVANKTDSNLRSSDLGSYLINKFIPLSNVGTEDTENSSAMKCRGFGGIALFYSYRWK